MDNVKYIGMDVHKEAICIAVLNSSGKLVMECTIETKASTILDFLKGLRGSLHVTFEEGTWAAWLYDLIKPHVAELVVCNPRRNALLKEGSKSVRTKRWGWKLPARCTHRRRVRYPARVPEPEYGSADCRVRRVGTRGVFSWKHQHVFLSETSDRGSELVCCRWMSGSTRFTLRRSRLRASIASDCVIVAAAQGKGFLRRLVQGKGKRPLPLHPIPSSN